MAPEAACAIYADAVDFHAWEASLGDSYIQFLRPRVAMREGVNRKKLWVMKGDLSNGVFE